MTKNLFASTMTGLSLILCLTTTSGQAWAQPNCGNPPDMLIVLDRSGSMSDMVGSQSKWAHAKAAVNQLVTTFANQIRFGLMLFPGPMVLLVPCDPGVVGVKVGDTTQAAIASKLNSSFPGGNTPIQDSLNNAHNYLIGIDPGRDKYVLLITDGQETCSGDPLTSVNKLAGAQIKTYVVGFGSGVDPNQLNNMAQAGGTALPSNPSYYQADSPTQLSQALQTIGSFVSCCGNGALDGGETCDTGIPQGQAGSCPTQCDDGNPCTVGAPAGTACNVECVFTPLSTPIHGDGCCPPGANSLNDNDCSASCGNGLLEIGEVCDPGIASGPGACKTEAECDDGDPCTEDSLGGSACDVMCVNTPKQPDPVNADGCCPAGHSQAQDADCLPECEPDSQEGTCVDLCQGVQCPDGQYCTGGQCKPWPTGSNNGTGGEDGEGTEGTEGTDPSNNPSGGTDPTSDQWGEGCACRAAGDAEGFFLWALLGLLWVAWRSRGAR